MKCKMSPEDLHSMKYSELQRHAKSAGIRANQKIDKLIKALTEYYDSGKQPVDEVTEATDAAVMTDELKTKANSSVISVRTSTGAEHQHGENRKRKRTFELEEPTLKGDSTPVIENDQPRVTRLRTSRSATPQCEETTYCQPVKRQRRNTSDKSPFLQDKDSGVGGSPTTKAIIDSIGGDCSSAERKEKLLSAIGKKVQMKMTSSPSNPVKSQPSQIPRFMAFLSNKKKDQQTSATPGSKTWDKIHKKEFSKFDSIDVYLEKKQQRKENLSASTKKRLSAKKSPAVKLSSKPSKQVSRDLEVTKIFKPTVITTKNINFDFSSKTPKAKAVNTPSRKQAPTSTKLGSTKKVPATTPFKFTGNSSTLNTTATLNTTLTLSKNKPVFDLKASLAKPLSWKPHTGRLQPAAAPRSTGIASQNRTRNVLSRDSANKMRPAQAKNVRRAAQLDRRSNQKYVDMMKRRGLLA